MEKEEPLIESPKTVENLGVTEYINLWRAHNDQNKQPRTRPPQTIDDFRELDHHKSWYKYRDQREFLENYAYLTDKVIDFAQNFETIDGVSHSADAVIFLDKSARPVSWLMRPMWPLVARPDQDSKIPPVPDIKYVNIDRLPWRKDKTVRIGDHPDNMVEPNTEDIEGLRAIFLKRPAKDGESPLDLESFLDGKRVVIVDEINDSGDTMRVADRLLSQAFPSSKFKTVSWMNRYRIAADGSKQVIERPTFYSERDDTIAPHFNENGRGVLDPDVAYNPVLGGKGVHGQVRAGSIYAAKKASYTEGSSQFQSSPAILPVQSPERIRYEDGRFEDLKTYQARVEKWRQDQEVERLLLEKILSFTELSDRQRKYFENRLMHVDFDTVDRKGRLLKYDMKAIPVLMGKLALTPAVMNFNGDQEAQITARRARVKELDRKPRRA